MDTRDFLIEYDEENSCYRVKENVDGEWGDIAVGQKLLSYDDALNAIDEEENTDQ